jgi:uncharacterized protein (DUF302 family)
MSSPKPVDSGSPGWSVNGRWPSVPRSARRNTAAVAYLQLPADDLGPPILVRAAQAVAAVGRILVVGHASPTSPTGSVARRTRRSCPRPTPLPPRCPVCGLLPPNGSTGPYRLNTPPRTRSTRSCVRCGSNVRFVDNTAHGIVSRRSGRDVTATVAAIRVAAEAKGATVSAVIDHAAAARAAGLEMPETQVIIFGNPHAGTPLMLAVPDVAVDLPLRVLVRDDGTPGTVVSWQDPTFVGRRFGLDATLLTPLRGVEAVVTAALDER